MGKRIQQYDTSYGTYVPDISRIYVVEGPGLQCSDHSPCPTVLVPVATFQASAVLLLQYYTSRTTVLLQYSGTRTAVSYTYCSSTWYCTQLPGINYDNDIERERAVAGVFNTWYKVRTRKPKSRLSTVSIHMMLAAEHVRMSDRYVQ